MSDSPAQNPLELEVKNFGPINEAKIDLRPLTVFVGPSNTGKSYLAVLIYALHQYFSDRFSIDALSGYQPYPIDYNIFWNDKENPFHEEILNELVEWAEQTFVDKEESSDERSILIPESVSSLVRSAFCQFDAQGGNLDAEISRCFGLSKTKALIRKRSQGGAKVILRKHVSEDSEPIVHKLTIDTRKTVPTTSVPLKIPTRTNSQIHSTYRELLRWKAETKSEYELIVAKNLIGALVASILSSLVEPLYLPAFYLPADRTGIMHAHTAVTSALIRRAPMTGQRQAPPTPMLSGVLADFLEQLINLDSHTYQGHWPHRWNDLGDQIEKSVLDGTVHIQRSETGYPRFTYRPEGWKDDLPLMNASSMVSELAPVVLYLRHVVRPGNVLIVEEPESHLHPAMQVEFTRQLAVLVRAGVRVIITTHSEWILEELANIVRLSGLPKAKRKGIEGGDIALRPDEVGAWLFQPKNRPRGSVVKEIPLDDDSGLFPSGFDEVAVALHNNWAEISSRDRGGANG